MYTPVCIYLLLGDGSITKEEFSNAFTSKFNANQEQASKVFGKVDKDGSGDISLDEISELFTLMDADGRSLHGLVILHSYKYICGGDTFCITNRCLIITFRKWRR